MSFWSGILRADTSYQGWPPASVRTPSVKLRSLIFVAATVPAEGRRPVDYLREDLRELAIDHHQEVLDGARGHTLGGLRDGEAPIETALEIVENGPRMGLEAPAPLLAEFSWAGFPSKVPRYFVRCLKDKVIPPDLADTMIANMGGATVVDLDAGHRAFDSHPARAGVHHRSHRVGPVGGPSEVLGAAVDRL